MERHEELSNRFCQLQSEVNALTREMGEINEEWASEGLKELGLKVGQVIKDGDDSYIVESRYGKPSMSTKWIVGRKIKTNGEPYPNTCPVYHSTT